MPCGEFFAGDEHATKAWPKEVVDLLTKRLACPPPCPYSFAASEALRLLGFKLDRAPVRRWQRGQIGELWQLDASPHFWFPSCPLDFPMLNMPDDCSRLFVGSKVYDRKTLLSYFDFLPAAFLAYGRPLQLYVDYHSIFFTETPEALTQLGWALKFYDISFLYAPTPQAKGKVEREHQFWQGRLPPYSPASKSPTPKPPPRASTLCASTTTLRKPTANSNRPRKKLGTPPSKKNHPSFDQARDALGGRMFGASAPPSKSVPTSASRSDPSDFASNARRVQKSFCASVLQATIPSSSPLPRKTPRP